MKEREKKEVNIAHLKAEENVQKLNQLAPAKVKLIYYFYRVMVEIKNDFIFYGILDLYDFICLRNQEIVSPKEADINIRRYLYGDFGMMKNTIGSIKKVYSDYAKEVIDYKYRRFKPEKIIEKRIEQNIKKQVNKEPNALKTA